ncbi:MAG TPA: alpha/beta hydrolase [Patescibacteria group bacterium]|nr:alpha/beta hydrolase [Patescibacteria group bacterium]
MPYLRVSQAEIYFEEIGTGEPVIFFHNSFSRGILAFAAQFAAFQGEFRCYFPDFRGHGRTTAAFSDWSVPGLADDLPELLSGWGIDRAHLVGYSLGGGVALYAASRYPDRVRSLVTIGTAGRVTAAIAANAADFAPERLLTLRGQEYIDLLTANHYSALKGDWQQLVTMTTENWRKFPQLSTEELAAITVPTLLIAGEQDPLVGQEDLEWLAGRIGNAVFHVIPGAGHGPHTVGEQPERLNRLMLDFLRSVAADGHGSGEEG